MFQTDTAASQQALGSPAAIAQHNFIICPKMHRLSHTSLGAYQVSWTQFRA